MSSTITSQSVSQGTPAFEMLVQNVDLLSPTLTKLVNSYVAKDALGKINTLQLYSLTWISLKKLNMSAKNKMQKNTYSKGQNAIKVKIGQPKYYIA